MTELLRVLIALAVVALLGRAVPTAWRNRGLTLAVWRRIRPRHVIGCVGLLAVVLSTLAALLAFVPGADLGLGRLVGLTGNAVFAPLEEATARSAAGEPDGGPIAAAWLPLVGTTVFLFALLCLVPWLAYVEERTFREGLESATLGRQITAALRFGLVHLVMLIPVGAALAIAVAGFAYGQVYRAAYRGARQAAAPRVGLFGLAVATPSTRHARDEAVLEATVWHATFNSLIITVVLAGFLTAAV